jgi:BirA family biotin operon repressor/biotin-[acetyl-CoA-carboxylase] ligase
MGNRIDHAILGIGINVNQLFFPSGLPNPVSIVAITDFHYDLPEIEDLFLESFVTHYSMLESGLFERISREYINKLYRFGESASFRIGSSVVVARISGITEFGQLILDKDDGTSSIFNYQELEYIIGDTD